MIRFNFDYELVMHLQEELRLVAQLRAQPFIDPNQRLDGNLCRGPLNWQIESEIPGVPALRLPDETINSATKRRDESRPSCLCLLLTLPASHASISCEEAIDYGAG